MNKNMMKLQRFFILDAKIKKELINICPPQPFFVKKLLLSI